MTDGSLKTLANADSARAMVRSMTISSDGRLVATGRYDAVHDLQSFVISKFAGNRSGQVGTTGQMGGYLGRYPPGSPDISM